MQDVDRSIGLLHKVRKKEVYFYLEDVISNSIGISVAFPLRLGDWSQDIDQAVHGDSTSDLKDATNYLTTSQMFVTIQVTSSFGNQ